MVTNLVSNAIKSTQSGGIVIGVRHGPRPRIEVHDTGSGLTPAQFETGLRAGGESRGLGLGIVADIAAETGVRVTHVVPAKRGTILQLWLPVTGDI